MKRIVIILSSIAALGCKSGAVGGSTQGANQWCKGTSGYTFSSVRQECIQVFEQGVRLDPVVVKKGKPTYSAFVIFELTPPSKQVELFLPMKKGSVLLPRISDEVYSDGKYRFHMLEKSLYIKNKLSFKNDKTL